jgi:hypothetical protein
MVYLSEKGFRPWVNGLNPLLFPVLSAQSECGEFRFAKMINSKPEGLKGL